MEPIKTDATSDKEKLVFNDQLHTMDESQILDSPDDPTSPIEGSCCGILLYPKSVFFVLGTEFCERFSFFGMKAILILYLITVHNLQDNVAKTIFHTFIMTCYFAPILGSIFADGYIGKYRAILYFSIIYCCGHVLLTVGTIPALGFASRVLDYCGLFVIAIATGGIKPCVCTFAADQFPPNLVRERDRFFSFFYFSVNVGAVLSQLVTPILRAKVSCLGMVSCFPLAFGIPALLMFLATSIFIAGKPFYKLPPMPDRNILKEVVACMGLAVCNRLKGRRQNKQHWLEYASETFGDQLVEDTKALLDVVVLLLPSVVFWALFDQMGSSWVLQASAMNGKLGSFTILPDQMSILNPILIVTLVPIFDAVVYPLLRYCRLLVTPLQRMSAGGVLAALSFVMAGLVQHAVSPSKLILPDVGYHRFFIHNAYSCNVTILPDTLGISSEESVMIDLKTLTKFKARDEKCPIEDITVNYNKLEASNGNMVLISNNATVFTRAFLLSKERETKAKVLFLGPYMQNATIVLSRSKETVNEIPWKETGAELSVESSRLYNLSLKICIENGCSSKDILSNFYAGTSAVYGIFLTNNETFPAYSMTLVSPNNISIWLQLPQYICMTCGEILFSITGLEFSYSQAPPRLKSVMQAVWLLTVAFGNLIAVFVSGSRIIPSAEEEYFVYALLMVVVVIIFMALSWCYTYKNYDQPRNGDVKKSNNVMELNYGAILDKTHTT